MSFGRRIFIRTVPVFAAVQSLAACTSPPTFYYRLAAVPGSTRISGPKAIGVRSVSIPGYLDQNGIAKPSANYQFETFGNQIWAEPLSDMLQSVMVQDLSQRFPASTVIGSGGSIAAPADILIEMNVLHFDPDPNGQITLAVQIALKSGNDRSLLLTQNFTRSVSINSADPAAIAAAMSSLWGAAADQVASLIVQAWADQSGSAS